MAYEIIGETIKSATSLKLGEIFGNDTIRYKENITKMKYPNFYINQLSVNITPAGTKNKRVQLDYYINIQYRIAENLETVSNINQQLDNIGFRLCNELTELDLELPTKTKNREYEKIDGILQFFFNITVFAIPETEEEIKFRELKLNEEVII